MTFRRSTPSAVSLFVFTTGDFAFNLYWQGVTLYLLYFYIDVLALPPAIAGTVFMVGALWDGVADLAVAAIIERTRVSYRRMIGWGAVPLGGAFVLMFAHTARSAVALLLLQIVFRTLYAATNTPYAAWTARLSDRSSVRTMLTGIRMMFGAAAAMLVALGLPWLAERSASPAAVGWSHAAALFVLAATPLLLIVVWIVPEPVRPATLQQTALRPQFAALVRNRAFVLLNVAAAAGSAATMLLSQSIPYYFRYVVQDTARGPQVLAAMAVAGAVALPAWTVLAQRTGARTAWLCAILLAILCLGAVAVSGRDGALPITALAVAFACFGLAGWSLVPDSVDWGEAHDGIRAETLAFGAFAFVQKAALAGTGLLIGATYQANGFVAGAAQTAATIHAIHWLMLGGPALLIAVCALAVLRLPLRRGTIAALRGRREPPAPIKRA
ncbi:MFS transporter [Sphingomonas arantia]|uniref:MFS transporter n=1 Tax=Sphingomonas arantia TaxID=1460676 RepID=A0ABW4TZJ9_9SPHN